ncbi:MAG: hypothetical protein KAR40_06090 [Candidatus Sabulitectum sp.]|nr:hypothetical protein [Candidatus Sabulitectum sp.]
MTKGLPRSLKHAQFQVNPITPTKLSIPINTTIVVTATGAAVGIGAEKIIASLPEGNIIFLGTAASLAFAGNGADANLSDTWNGDYAIGTADDVNGTLAGAEVNVAPSVAVGPAVAEVAAAVRSVLAAPVNVDQTAAVGAIYLNLIIDAADITDDESVTITVNGTVDILYQVLGDD